jgi:hypothetical protein
MRTWKKGDIERGSTLNWCPRKPGTVRPAQPAEDTEGDGHPTKEIQLSPDWSQFPPASECRAVSNTNPTAEGLAGDHADEILQALGPAGGSGSDCLVVTGEEAAGETVIAGGLPDMGGVGARE